ATKLLQILLGALLDTLVHDGFAGLALAWRIVGSRLLLGADREHLDPELGDLGRRQASDLDAFEHLAQLRRNVGRAADDLLAHRDVLELTGEGDALVATLEAGAQGLCFALAAIDERL